MDEASSSSAAGAANDGERRKRNSPNCGCNDEEDCRRCTSTLTCGACTTCGSLTSSWLSCVSCFLGGGEACDCDPSNEDKVPTVIDKGSKSRRGNGKDYPENLFLRKLAIQQEEMGRLDRESSHVSGSAQAAPHTSQRFNSIRPGTQDGSAPAPAPIGFPPGSIEWTIEEGDEDEACRRIREQVAAGQFAVGRAVDEARNVLLHLAARQGQLDLIALLLSLGERVNVRNSLGQTPLHLASRTGQDAAVRLLLEAGADPAAATGHRSTALHFAAVNGHLPVLRTLLPVSDTEARGPVGFTALHTGAQEGQLAVVAALVDGGANRNARNDENATPLYIAASKGHAGVVQYLLAQKAEKEARAVDGSTATMAAAALGHNAALRLLIEAHADCNKQTRKGLTALHFAAAGGHSETCGMLLRAGANKSARSVDGASPLHSAAAGGHAHTLEVLLRVGPRADVDVKNKSGSTPLMLAAEGGHADAVRVLVAYGGDPRATDRTGRNAGELAEASGAGPSVVALLQDATAALARLPRPATRALTLPLPSLPGSGKGHAPPRPPLVSRNPPAAAETPVAHLPTSYLAESASPPNSPASPDR